MLGARTWFGYFFFKKPNSFITCNCPAWLLLQTQEMIGQGGNKMNKTKLKIKPTSHRRKLIQALNCKKGSLIN